MKKFVVIFILLFTATSCKKDYQLENIDSDIWVSVVANGSDIIINAKTGREYTCNNFGIKYCLRTNKDRIYVGFKKIQVPDFCLTSLGPATCNIAIPELKNGEYPITFELNNRETKGTLLIGNTVELILNAGGNVKTQ